MDRTWVRVRRVFDSIPVGLSAVDIPPEQWLLALILPGYAYVLLRRNGMALLMVAGWLLGLLAFLIFLGNTWVMGWALGAMASSHSSGQGFLILREREQNTDVPGLGLLERLWIPLACWFGCMSMIYWPAGNAFQTRIALPIQVAGKQVIIDATTPLKSLNRGEPVAYHLDPEVFGVARSRGGYGFDVVLGLPGDHVVFGPQDVRVNGRPFSRRREMPPEGELFLKNGMFLIWPTLEERVVNIDRSLVDQAYYRLALVPEAKVIGRPFRHWFFRTQPIP